jgi:ubiquinone/menaquinone biosynthesis C-methylase UbiE
MDLLQGKNKRGLNQDEVRRIYGRVAPVYDLWGRVTESMARRRCLEVAVGTGIAFVEILRANPTGRNEGVDLSDGMLGRARRRAKALGVGNYRLGLGDAYQLEYPDETFDLVITNYLFDLLPDADFPVVLGEFKRVLRRGGRVATANMTGAERWYQGLWELISRLNPAWFGGCRAIFLKPYLESAGFVAVRREFISQMTLPSEVVQGVKPPAAT